METMQMEWDIKKLKEENELLKKLIKEFDEKQKTNNKIFKWYTKGC